MAEAKLTIASKNYGSWSLRGWLLCKMAGIDFKEQQTASDDIVRQFRYYLFTADAPEIAVGIRGSMRAVNQAYHSPLIVVSNPIGTKQCACSDTHK